MRNEMLKKAPGARSGVLTMLLAPVALLVATFDGNVLPSNPLRKREETGVQQVSVSQRAKAIRR